MLLPEDGGFEEELGTKTKSWGQASTLGCSVATILIWQPSLLHFQGQDHACIWDLNQNLGFKAGCNGACPMRGV